MKVYNFFRCPFFEECTGKAPKYEDKETEFYLQDVECRGGFLFDASGNPVCMLSLPENRKYEYPEIFRGIRRK